MTAKQKRMLYQANRYARRLIELTRQLEGITFKTINDEQANHDYVWLDAQIRHCEAKLEEYAKRGVTPDRNKAETAAINDEETL